MLLNVPNIEENESAEIKQQINIFSNGFSANKSEK